MNASPKLLIVVAGALSLCQGICQAEETITLSNVPKAPKITGREPMANKFSFVQAARYLDTASLSWQKIKKCATCHTNIAYMFARPALDGYLKHSGEVRQFFEAYRTERWKSDKVAKRSRFWPIVVGAGLTMNDLQTTGKLHPITRDVLDIMWTTQRPDGGWDWPDCEYAPIETDDHYGVTLAALVTGLAPDGYAHTDAAKVGLQKIRQFLANDPPKSLHHRVMIAWCSVRIDGLISPEQRAMTLEQMLAIQRPDGGWATPGYLADWKGLKRHDGKPHDLKTSDAYGTGLALVVARELGVPADDARLKRGVAWLLGNQRENGMWFTHSPSLDRHHYMTNTGTAYAVLGLQACGKLPGWPLGSKKSPEK